ncbi:MAG: universal stress protein [Phycisphaerales bacterium]|nr:universal stress protein [Phycisphaerales bacterium]MCI0675839.1 universal stress protein [Phycisphaerales bacterium]
MTTLSTATRNPQITLQAFETILVATDFSGNARQALNWAVELARTHGAKITLVHAIDPSRSGEREQPTGEQIQKNLASTAKIVRGWQVNAVVEHEIGKPWKVIADAAAKFEADLIVMGKRGDNTMRRKLLGGTADRVIRTATVPVLVVHPDDDRIGRGFRRILAAIDFSEESLQALEAALRMVASKKDSTEVVLLTVCELGLPYPGFEFAATHPNYWDNMERDARRDLEKLADPIRRNGFNVETRTTRGFAGSAILEQAAILEADLIAVGTQGRGGLNRFLMGSVAEHVLEEARCPVLTVRNANAGS